MLCFASDPRSQHLNDGGKITLPARRRTVEVVLKSGETIGELVCTYVGEYTQENLDQVQRMNRGVLDDLDFVQPGEASKKSKPRSLARSAARCVDIGGGGSLSPLASALGRHVCACYPDAPPVFPSVFKLFHSRAARRRPDLIPTARTSPGLTRVTSWCTTGVPRRGHQDQATRQPQAPARVGGGGVVEEARARRGRR